MSATIDVADPQRRPRADKLRDSDIMIDKTTIGLLATDQLAEVERALLPFLGHARTRAQTGPSRCKARAISRRCVQWGR